MNIADIGKAWEGRMLDARLPLRQWLGTTDHSCVYLTEVAGPKSPKAVVKIFPADFFDQDRQLDRWRALAQLNFPYLLRVLDGGRSELDGTPFLFVVTDFADEDLSQILPQRALTPDEVKDLLPPLLEALAYLHKSGYIHGHIQPSNVMASGDKLKLSVDRAYTVGERRDTTSLLTPYDAPETATGPVTTAADIWSLGMFLIAALKQRPLPVTQNPSTAPNIPSDIPEPLRSIITDCLVLNPKDRCTLAEIGAWLEPLSATAAAAASAAATPVTKPATRPASAKPSAPVRIVEVAEPEIKVDNSKEPQAPTSRSNWRVAVPIAVVALIVALVLGQRLFSHKPEPAAPPATETTEAKPVAQPAAQPATPPNPTKPAPTPPDDPILHRVVPELSANVKRRIHGTLKVTVHVDVDPSGKVIAAKVTTPSSSHYFNNLAQITAQQWEFVPPQQNGDPIPSTWQLRFQFNHRSTEVFPSRAPLTKTP
jgi:TonB family protein